MGLDYTRTHAVIIFAVSTGQAVDVNNDGIFGYVMVAKPGS
jgi:hypothetical protein